jgi:glycosyltransferase involved in cell wall biosynthesis
MKVLFVTSTLPTGDTDPVPAFVKDQLVALKKNCPSLQISVLAPHDRRSATQRFVRRPAYDEYRFHYFWPFAAEKLAGRGIMPALSANPLNCLLIPFLFLGEFLALLALTRKLRPAVIYAHWFTPQGVIASWVGRLTGTSFVFTTHAADVEVWSRIPLIGRHVVRSSATRARAFTAVSRRSMQKLQRFFSAGEWADMQRRGAVIPMGVASPEVRPQRSTAEPDRTVILFLGRLVEKKGVQYLLPAYARARARLGRSLLVIAGDGPMLESLQRQADCLGLGESVSFPGFVTGQDKIRLLLEADIHVVPSIITDGGDAEGLPVALMEGLAYGKVCIATAESGADDILTNGKDGFLVPEKNADALAAALLQAALLDPRTRRDMQAEALRSAQQFDWATVARRHHEFLLGSFDDAKP